MVRFSLSAVTVTVLSTHAHAQSFATDTIGGTAGFGSVIDSGPGALSSAVIDGRMAALAAEATSQGCTPVEWAGTWVRSRSPRVQGATDAGGTVLGPALTNGTVDGTPFTASLASGGALAGSTASGNALNGFFARVSSSRSIWYGVETDCSGPPEPPGPLLAFYDFDGNLDDQAGNAPALSLVGPAALTSGGGGVNGEALDLGGLLNNAVALGPTGSHFDALFTNNAVAVSWWQLTTGIGENSSFSMFAPGVTSHALQVHATWIDGVFYFDHSGCCASNTRTTVPPGPIQLGQWQHILVQKDATGLREIWVDGAFQTSQGGGAALPLYDGRLVIGGFSPSGGGSMSGRIDEFAIFSQALTVDEIQALAGGASPLAL